MHEFFLQLKNTVICVHFPCIGIILKIKRKKRSGRLNLGKAIAIFKDCGSDEWAEKYEKELAELS